MHGAWHHGFGYGTSCFLRMSDPGHLLFLEQSFSSELYLLSLFLTLACLSAAVRPGLSRRVESCQGQRLVCDHCMMMVMVNCTSPGCIPTG
jgi:hypothetical protein